MKKSVGNWHGKPIEKHTKKELVDIIVQLAKELIRTRKRHTKDLNMIISAFEWK